MHELLPGQSVWFDMRAVIQRVKCASVSIDSQITSSIQRGLVVLVGVGRDDRQEDADYLAEKTANIRIFADENGKMNLSALDLGAEVLVISQFTLYGDCRKGRRPGFSDAALPDHALALYEYYVERLRSLGLAVNTGEFGANMLVEIHNEGPVTILLDSKRLF